MATDVFRALAMRLAPGLLTLILGCGKPPEAELDTAVVLLSVICRPAEQLTWIGERDKLTLNEPEKHAIRAAGLLGQFEVLKYDRRGSGSKLSRVVIITAEQPTNTFNLPVPVDGSAIYYYRNGTLNSLQTNSMLSSLVVEVVPESGVTSYFINYPRDQVRYGGFLFLWDDSGNPREL